MSYKLKEQFIKRHGVDLPAELAYNTHLSLDKDNVQGFVDGLIAAYEANKDYYVVPSQYVTGTDDFIQVFIRLQDEWFEKVEPFEPTEYRWYEINKVNDCIFEDDDTILTRNWLGKIEIAKNKEELLSCNRSVISQFLVIHCDVPF